MSFKDFARKYFPLPHTKKAKSKGRKKRPTISGFHVGDLVQHRYSYELRGRIRSLRGEWARVEGVGYSFTRNLQLIEAAE